MFRRVLVANRGEIACRVIATLREHGIESVAVYSDIDAEAVHVRMADLAVRVGPAEAKDSYLNVETVVEAALATSADAIHPGYGFLSENPAFVRAVEGADLTFVGPTAEQAEQFGDKRASREVALEAGVPIVPGYDGLETHDEPAIRSAAEKIGFPVIVKAALGGGGKGMQIVDDPDALHAAFVSASRLGASAFGDASVYLERAIVEPRHVEVQVLGDGNGEAVHLFERECSLQRRHQKVIEETPSPGIDERTREGLLDAAVRLAKQIGYRGAGTVEFLVAPDGKFYFLEMNTRLQVEHPVTEWVTGLDLVWLQLQVAESGRLPIEQSEVTSHGHAVEARLYAEDAANGFLPQAGELTLVEWPRRPFVRVDAGVETGSHAPVQYDPILAKVSTWGATRDDALHRLAAALDDTVVQGVISNRHFLRSLATHPDVQSGEVHTTWLESDFQSAFESAEADRDLLLALAAASVAMQSPGGRGRSSTPEHAGPPFADPFAALGAWRAPGSRSS